MDTPLSVALNGDAPRDERIDATSVAQRALMPRAMSDLLPASDIQPIIDYINADLEEQVLNKALQKNNIIPFPSKRTEGHKRGMQSVWIDDMQINVNGDYFERPGNLSFDGMRSMVEQTPILNAVIMTRVRQCSRFCQVGKSDDPGFNIRFKDDDRQPKGDEKQSIVLLEQFFTHCGWETDPRRRQRLKRDSFSNFMAKAVRDTLTMDSAPIETEFKRDRSLGLDGMYAVDGSTIRLCSEEGYEGDDEVFALQVIQGRIRSAYTYNDLIYVPRNPRTDVIAGGYGLSETELLIRVVTGFLNAFTYNTKYFDSNSIPKGLLHLSGNYTEADIGQFKRYWAAMVKGVNNAWNLPVMISKDQESKAEYQELGAAANEVMFAKWMTLLTSIICALYCIAPDEINFESFSAGTTSSLSGNDTEEKLTNSKDKGLRPLLTYFSNIFTDFVVGTFSDKFCFVWEGLDDEDKKQSFEEVKLCNTVNELRAARGEDKAEGAWGDAPLNASLLSVWQAEQQAENADFGQPGEAQPGMGEPGDGDDFGSAQDPGAPPGDGQDTDDGDQPGQPGGVPPAAANKVMSKAFGLPVFSSEEF
jgi:hypothetical protein